MVAQPQDGKGGAWRVVRQDSGGAATGRRGSEIALKASAAWAQKADPLISLQDFALKLCDSSTGDKGFAADLSKEKEVAEHIPGSEMGTMVVSASKGVLSSVLAKLTTLMGDEFKKLKGVRKQASFLKDELSNINAFLETLDLMDELDPLAKDWRSHVREMAYDIENCIDDFMHHLGEANPTEGFINKTMRRLKTIRQRHRIAHQIDELRTRVLEASERRTRYMLDERVSNNPGSVAVDRRVPALFTEATNLVGIDEPREELVKWLINTHQQLMVVSIVGFGGLGKTTLAKEVYHNIKEQFKCVAFVSVSQRPDMTRLLNSIWSKLGIEDSFPTGEVQDNVSIIREYLKQKRYLIVVDDLWDAQAWDIIKCAFPENYNGSRVIVTTRVQDVARRACGHQHECIYRMKPLNNQDSSRLFFNRIFGCEDGCPSQFEEISTEILKKCGGLPLAIITIASILGNRPTRLRKEWQNVLNSLSMQIGSNPTLEDVRQILDLSYKNLPHRLRTCFLYLGIYPEDYLINRDDLISQWVAEGFVGHFHGQDTYDVARSYFNELINRSLIQPERIEYGEVLSCRVHDMMLDLILHRCEEDNFVTVVSNSEKTDRQHDKMVRRISLSFNMDEYGYDRSSHTTVPDNYKHIVVVDHKISGTFGFGNCLSQVLSLAVFGKSKCIPMLMSKYIRVLIIDIFSPWTKRGDRSRTRLDLTSITQLFQLKYLQICMQGNAQVQLPDKIQGLKHLETLKIDRCGANIPSDIIYLHHLSHLIVPRWVLVDGLDSMKSLRTLETLIIDDDQKACCLRELRELTKLKLHIDRLHTRENKNDDIIFSSLAKLRNLKCLDVLVLDKRWSMCDKDNRLGWLSNPPIHLEKLVLRGLHIPRFPRWINVNLKGLCCLHLQVHESSTEEVGILGELPSLVTLTLDITDKPWYRRHHPVIVFCVGSFQALEDLDIHYGDDATSLVRFEAPGVLPNLWKLTFRLWPLDWGGAAPEGMEHLVKLRYIYLFCIEWSGEESNRDSELECFFKNYATQVHPSRPTVSCSVCMKINPEVFKAGIRDVSSGSITGSESDD
ncbi:hypothetical protein U9M48_030617 [Paspalum notatum var. saurae]|uniref:Uncharacterized protein n=1 Tax=Paspalum notatum var. saurae TaxID=547442 RepID=A0AAQ3U0M1_PASNO